MATAAEERAQAASGSEFRSRSSTSSPVSASPGPRRTPYHSVSAGSETQPLLDAGGDDAGDTPALDGWDGSNDFAELPRWRRPSIWWLMGPYILLTLAFGGSVVPKLNLIVSLVCSQYYSERWTPGGGQPTGGLSAAPVVVGGDNPQCTVPEVQREVAAFMLALSMLTGLLSAFTAPKIGSWSDRYGRRRMMVLTSTGGVLSEAVVILAATYPDLVPYTWLLAGAAFDGLAGSFTAASLLSHSYTADCTSPSGRGVAIGYLHASLFAGLAGGPLIAGYLVEWTGSLVSVFYVALSSHLFFILFSLFAIPESLSIRRQLVAREKYAREMKQAVQEEEEEEGEAPVTTAARGSGNGVVQSTRRLSVLLGSTRLRRAARSLKAAHPLAPLKILYPQGSSPGAVRLRRNLLTLAVVDVIIMGFSMGAGTVILLYIEYMFNWDNLQGSMFLSFTSLVRVLVLLVLLPAINHFFRTRPAARLRRRQQQQLLVHRINNDNYNYNSTGALAEAEKNAGSDIVDIWILRVALVSDVVSMVGYALVRSQQLFVMLAAVAALGGLGSATIQASLSKHVPAERVGQLLGAIGLLHALSRVVAPLLFNGLYALTVESFPQAIFILLGAMFAIALAASLLIRPHVFMTEDDEPTSLQSEPARGAQPYTQDELEDDQLLPGLP